MILHQLIREWEQWIASVSSIMSNKGHGGASDEIAVTLQAACRHYIEKHRVKNTDELQILVYRWASWCACQKGAEMFLQMCFAALRVNYSRQKYACQLQMEQTVHMTELLFRLSVA